VEKDEIGGKGIVKEGELGRRGKIWRGTRRRSVEELGIRGNRWEGRGGRMKKRWGRKVAWRNQRGRLDYKNGEKRRTSPTFQSRG